MWNVGWARDTCFIFKISTQQLIKYWLKNSENNDKANLANQVNMKGAWCIGLPVDLISHVFQTTD